MRKPSVHNEEELDELPPLDGEPGEAVEPEAEVDPLPRDAAEPFDDATPGDDPISDAAELDLDEGAASWLGELPDAPDLDLGETALLSLEGGLSADEGDETEATLDDFALAEAIERTGLDAGDEGPIDPDEDLRDEDLPALDSDDEGEGDDAAFWDSKIVAEAQVDLKWAGKPWLRVGAPLAVAGVTALRCVARGALVAGRVDAGPSALARVDLEGACEVLDAEGANDAQILSLSAAGALVSVVLEGGRLAVSTDGGRRFRACASGIPVADAVVAGPRLWVQTRSGGLLVSSDQGALFARCPLPGAVVAISVDGDRGILALSVGPSGLPLALAHGGFDGTVAREPLDVPFEVAAPAVLASRGGPVAYVARDGVVRRGADGVWRTFSWEGKVTALAFLDERGTLLAATYSDVDDASSLVRLDIDGKASIVARVGAGQDLPDSDGQAVALACDDSWGVVWLAGGFGVAAFAVAADS